MDAAAASQAQARDRFSTGLNTLREPQPAAQPYTGPNLANGFAAFLNTLRAAATPAMGVAPTPGTPSRAFMITTESPTGPARGPGRAPTKRAQDESAFFPPARPTQTPSAASTQPARTSPAKGAPAKKGGRPAPYLKRGRQNWERGKNYTGDGARNSAARLRVLATAQRQQKKS